MIQNENIAIGKPQPLKTTEGIRMPIITVDQRLTQKRGIKGVILGKSGIGKTSLLNTLPADTTLFWDLEAGDLAVENWKGDAIRPTTWQECRDFACMLGGPNKALRDDQFYSKAHFDSLCSKYGSSSQFEKYDTIFIDSVTAISRLCFQWCSNQPQSFSEKTGKPDVRATYGLLGKEIITWFTHLQHVRNKNIWFIAILDEKLDEYSQKTFHIQMEGSSAALALPGIVDEIITLAEIKTEKGPDRAFVCHTINPYNYPAKDRSGCLEMLEAPHLQKLMTTIQEKKRAQLSSAP